MRRLPLAALLLAVGLAACSHAPTAPSSPDALSAQSADAKPSKTCGSFALDITARKWSVDLYPNQPFYQLADGSLAQDFTLTTTGDIGYGHTAPPCAAPRGSVTLTAQQIGLGALLPWDAGDMQPVKIRAQWFAYSLDWSNPDRRWWSVDGITLTPGMSAQTVTTSLQDASRWSQVTGINGASEPSIYADASAHMVRLGWTVGGMFYGHGAYSANGQPATLVIRAEGVQ